MAAPLGEPLALLYAHPNVYVDIAGLQSPAITPHAGYAWYLLRQSDAFVKWD